MDSLLARSPEEQTRMIALYPDSNQMTPEAVQASVCKQQCISLDQARAVNADTVAARNYPSALLQAEDQHHCNLQNSPDKAKGSRLATPEEINDMVVAAEQLAMPVADEFDLGRGKRPRLVETYKEPDGREF